ncbi:MAG: polysaccharide pyruvyl transferase family protein [Clostridiales bacterium]|nr:polysaccharide pyruvyl transferase family protein [Clostridiales bacterium]
MNSLVAEKKIIEVVGPSFQNKGDALMSYAIEKRLGSRYKIAYDTKTQAPFFLARLIHGVNRRLPRQMRRSKYYLAHLLPKTLRLSWQIIDYNDICGTLDCSGFQYGDQWIRLAHKLSWRIDHYRKLRESGKKVIMLPQAFGPFQSKIVRELILNILNNVDLVFVRDKASAHNLLDLKIDTSLIKIVPDITNIIKGKRPKDDLLWADRVCIVPNKRMLDMTKSAVRNKYIDFIIAIINEVRKRKLNPVILLHEKGDYPLAKLINSRLGIPLLIIDEDPIITKGIIGCCHSVISSRYHALVSALSQSIPSLGTTWTHKYASLFEEFGCPECIFESLDSYKEVEKKLDLLTNPYMRSHLIIKIEEKADIAKKNVLKMWEIVEMLLES